MWTSGQISATFVTQPHKFTSSANPCCCLLLQKSFCLALWRSQSHLIYPHLTMGLIYFAKLHFDNCFVGLQMSVWVHNYLSFSSFYFLPYPKPVLNSLVALEWHKVWVRQDLWLYVRITLLISFTFYFLKEFVYSKLRCPSEPNSGQIGLILDQTQNFDPNSPRHTIFSKVKVWHQNKVSENLGQSPLMNHLMQNLSLWVLWEILASFLFFLSYGIILIMEVGNRGFANLRVYFWAIKFPTLLCQAQNLYFHWPVQSLILYVTTYPPVDLKVHFQLVILLQIPAISSALYRLREL